MHKIELLFYERARYHFQIEIIHPSLLHFFQ